MNISLINNRGSQVTYVNGQIVLPASGSVTVSYGLIPYIAVDFGLKNDLLNLNTSISDGYSTYTGSQAVDLLTQIWVGGTPPQNSNDPVSFSLAGFGFSANASATLSSSTETSILLLTNPSNSGKNARAMFFFAAPASSTGIVTIKGYVNPTVTNNGTALSINNNLVIAGAPSSICNAYTSPTTSNDGTLMIGLVSSANADTDMINFAQTAILTPGNSLLLTVSVANLGLLATALTYFYLQWVEA